MLIRIQTAQIRCQIVLTVFPQRDQTHQKSLNAKPTKARMVFNAHFSLD